jgi:hypothetical protein
MLPLAWEFDENGSCYCEYIPSNYKLAEKPWVGVLARVVTPTIIQPQLCQTASELPHHHVHTYLEAAASTALLTTLRISRH